MVKIKKSSRQKNSVEEEQLWYNQLNTVMIVKGIHGMTNNQMGYRLPFLTIMNMSIK